jgi:hypothetical protein
MPSIGSKVAAERVLPAAGRSMIAGVGSGLPLLWMLTDAAGDGDADLAHAEELSGRDRSRERGRRR